MVVTPHCSVVITPHCCVLITPHCGVVITPHCGVVITPYCSVVITPHCSVIITPHCSVVHGSNTIFNLVRGYQLFGRKFYLLGNIFPDDGRLPLSVARVFIPALGTVCHISECHDVRLDLIYFI